jgi:predicted MFS family arabinose efflux permease
VIHFLHSIIGFNLYSIVMWILTESCGFDDRVAGILFALFGPVSSVYALLGGPVIDKLLITKSLLLQTALAIVGMIIMTASLHPAAVLVALFGPIAMASSMNHTVILVALQRYIPDTYRTMAFSTKYVIMNVGAVLSSIMVDVFRLYVNPQIHFIAPWSFFIGCCVLLQVPIMILIGCGIRDVEAVVVQKEEYSTDVEFTDLSYSEIPEDNFEGMQEDTDMKVSLQKASPPAKPSAKCCTGQEVAWQMQPYDNSTQPQSLRELGVKIRRVLWDSRFWKFVLFSTLLLGAKTVFVYMYSLYPVYMKRATFDGNSNGAAMPFMMFTVADPVIVIVLSWVMGWLINKYNFERYWVIVAGTVIGAGAPFFMMLPHYWAVIMFIVVMAIGESVWSPVYDRYIAEFTQRGDEGIFFGLATIPTTLGKKNTRAARACFLKKFNVLIQKTTLGRRPSVVFFIGHMISTMSSGFLLESFCPTSDNCGMGRWIWFIAGCGAISTPILLLASIRWTRLKSV